VAKEKKEEGGGEEEETEEEEAKEIFVPWQNFKPTYRGKEKRTVKPLDLMRVSRMSLMMRRYGTRSLRSFCYAAGFCSLENLCCFLW